MDLSNIALFKGLSQSETESYISAHGGVVRNFAKEEYIFLQNDMAEKIYILLQGEVIICKDFYTGHRHIVARFNSFGEIFAEVYAFLKSHRMDYSAYADTESKILELPSDILFLNSGMDTDITVMRNFINILAQKTYFLNKKLQILSSKSLKSKLSGMILFNCNDKGYWFCNMTRDSLADYLNVARPSLSRELMKMQNEGLIYIDGAKIYIKDKERLSRLI